MSREAPVKQADLKRYLKAHLDAGIKVARTEIGRDGTVVIFTPENTTLDEPNEWDSI